MSRAFVKDSDENPRPEDELNLPPLEGPVLLTPAGLARLEERLHHAQGEVARYRGEESPDGKLAYLRALRELRLLEQQRGAAVVVDPAQHGEHADTAAFGAHVTVEDEEGNSRTYVLVGEVEADPAKGLINVKSPLAEALLGQRVGDTVTWRRPAGEVTLTITAIEYPER
ncbi:MAG TPA: GreA/GreB family elongation factor [Alphaproteobacteria bacterium]|nr:GreA/GreB family elongation factor [Alphaproteobacteria bacterium]